MQAAQKELRDLLSSAPERRERAFNEANLWNFHWAVVAISAHSKLGAVCERTAAPRLCLDLLPPSLAVSWQTARVDREGAKLNDQEPARAQVIGHVQAQAFLGSGRKAGAFHLDSERAVAPLLPRANAYYCSTQTHTHKL